MAVALEQFVKQLEDSGIIPADALKEFLPPHSEPKDANDLARELVRQKRLTKFQAEEVSKGKGKSLILGNYVLLEKIGAGGMGQVFKARHQRMDRLVAVKLLPAAMTKDAAAIARFEREVKAAARLRHPNIIAADDADQSNGIHYLVMELVDGSDLSAMVKADGPFPVDKAVNYILQAAKGLEAAHAEGIVHRDIKPANLLLDKKGTVKILDMGLARIHGDAGAQAELTATGAVMGTVDYMAPEQALNTKTADARADIYSLGCSLFYLLTAKATYDGDTLMAKLLAHRDQPVPALRTIRPEVPASLDRVFKKMIAKKIEDRYQTMTEVVGDLQNIGAVPTNTSTLQTTDTDLKPLARDTAVASRTMTLSSSVKDALPKPVPPPIRKASKASEDAHAIDFLDDLPEIPVRSSRSKKTGKNSKKGKSSLLQDPISRLLIAAGAVGIVVLLAFVMVSVKTKHGTLVVSVNEPDAKVEVLNESGKEEGSVKITRTGDKDPITISVVPGKRQLRVQKDGFELVTQDFEIKSGDKQSITAKLVPLETKSASNSASITAAGKSSGSVPVGWTNLFDGKSLDGWKDDAGVLRVENGVLVSDGKRGVAVAPGEYQDIEAEIEFRLANKGNSGLGICYAGSGDPAENGLEIQMLDDDGYVGITNMQKCGSLFAVAAVNPGHFKRWPEWNVMRVASRGDEIQVELNGTIVTTASRAAMNQANPKHAGVMRSSGKICLFPIAERGEYRNFRIRSAPAAPAKLLAITGPPPGATVFNGHTYKFFPESLSWKQAKARCEEMCGHLPYVESDEENTFLAELAAKSIGNPGEYDAIWLGATDEQQEGDWKWLNGNPLTFTKWNPGQPNNKLNEEHYLIQWIPKREWADQPVRSVQHPMSFICEWDSPPGYQ